MKIEGMNLPDQWKNASATTPLDLIICSVDRCKCITQDFHYVPKLKIAATNTIFGWTITGSLRASGIKVEKIAALPHASKTVSIVCAGFSLDEFPDMRWDLAAIIIDESRDGLGVSLIPNYHYYFLGLLHLHGFENQAFLLGVTKMGTSSRKGSWEEVIKGSPLYRLALESGKFNIKLGVMSCKRSWCRYGTFPG